MTSAWLMLRVLMEPVSTSTRPTMSGSCDLMKSVMRCRLVRLPSR